MSALRSESLIRFCETDRISCSSWESSAAALASPLPAEIDQRRSDGKSEDQEAAWEFPSSRTKNKQDVVLLT